MHRRDFLGGILMPITSTKPAALELPGRGPMGLKGDMPAHQWTGTNLSFQNPDGSMGPSVPLLGPEGPTGGEQNFPTALAIEGAQVTGAVTYIRTAGYSAVGSGGALYTRVASEPAHTGKFQSLDGSWWELSENAVTPQMFGAKGNSDATGTEGDNDTAAFQAMTAYVNERGGGRVIIPTGETGYYKVFSQAISPTPNVNDPYYQSAGDLMHFIGCKGLEIEFTGCELVAESGLRYGSFDPVSGAFYDHGGDRFTNNGYQASIGAMIRIEDCSHYIIKNAVLNGNNENYVHGGYWGDKGRQVAADGIHISDSEYGEIVNFHSHHHGRDGIYVTGREAFALHLVLRNGKSLYNGRQGMSWTGGAHLSAYNMLFSKTGYGGVASAPAAGLDIEHNGQGVADGYFETCQFTDNKGVSLVNDQSAGVARMRFKDCLIQNPVGRRAFWFRQQATLDGCDIYGNVVQIGPEVEFNRCRFSNEEYNGEIGATRLLDINNPARFIDCIIRTSDNDDYNFNIRGGAYFLRPRFIFAHEDVAPGRNLGIFGDVTLIDAEFIDDLTFTGDTTANQSGSHPYIATNPATKMIGRCTISGGPYLAWAAANGAQNCILNAVQQPQYTSEQSHKLSGAGPTFDIDVGSGNNLVILYKTNGNSILRRVSAIFLQASENSDAADRHSFTMLAAKAAHLGTGGNIATALSGSSDVIRITQGTIALDTEVFIIRKIALTGGRLAI